MIHGAEAFKQHLLDAGIKDEGVHHGFKKGAHGEKLEFEVVKPGSALWAEWAELTARLIHAMYPDATAPVLESTANGTIEITSDVATLLNRHGNYDNEVVAIHTEKLHNPDGSTFVRLTNEARRTLWAVEPKSVVKIDDAASTGSTTAYTAPELRSFGVEDVTAVYAWMRQLQLPFLDRAGVRYEGIIDNHEMPSFTPEDCLASGFCAEGVPFIAYGQTEAVILRDQS